MAVRQDPTSHSIWTHELLTGCIVQGALEWLEKNEDKPIDELQADAAEEDDDAATQAKIAELETGQAKSMVCNECGKKFRSINAAEFHASKTYVP